MSKIHVGVIGCGRIARFVHIRNLLVIPNCELTALADSDLNALEQAQRLAPSARVFTDYEELLESAEVDAVLICLPTLLHSSAAIQAIQKEKHVYLEKPFAVDLMEAQSLLERWKNSGLVGMIGFNYRFNPLYRELKEKIQLGSTGSIAVVRSVFSTATANLSHWKKMRQTGGGVLIDLACHHIDLFRFLFEREVQKVFCEIQSLRSEEDSAALHLELETGVLIQSYFSLSTVEEDRIEVYGQKGKLSVDRYLSLRVSKSETKIKQVRKRLLWQGGKSLLRSPYVVKKMLAAGNEPSYREALVHFLNSIRGKAAAKPDFLDGYINLSVIKAAEKSAETKRIVSTSEPVFEG